MINKWQYEPKHGIKLYKRNVQLTGKLGWLGQNRMPIELT